ncbi:MAG TPA: NTP transferase domain-containing protein [Streptosporangiaceae bacterium]|nr:NTP transferase domain-containing protein [Streptosporangiaceae bacterium]
MPPPPLIFDAIVLAGGHASRLGGVDKPGLVVGARTLLASVVSAATAAGAGRVVVVGPQRPGTERLGTERPGTERPGEQAAEGHVPGPGGAVRYVREEPPGAGPVAALSRGLADVSAPVVAVLAADLPFLRAAHLGLLLSALDARVGRPGPQPRGAGVVLVDDRGRAQWLTSCWRTAVLAGAAGDYRGNSLHGLLGPLDPAGVRYALAADEPPPWLDCDTAEDLRRARAWSEQQASR